MLWAGELSQRSKAKNPDTSIKFLIFTNFTGSLYSSNRHIEPELLKTVQHYSILDELSTSCDENQHLSTCLPYIAFKKVLVVLRLMKILN